MDKTLYTFLLILKHLFFTVYKLSLVWEFSVYLLGIFWAVESKCA